MSEPVAGNHFDHYNLEVHFEVVRETLEQANIFVEELFPDDDTGFDSKDFRKTCDKKEINTNICYKKRCGNADRHEYFDKVIYDERYAVERTNAWMDSCHSLAEQVRYHYRKLEASTI